MSEQVKELVKRVRLTPKELMIAGDAGYKEFEKDMNRMTLADRVRTEIAEAQLNKVLNDDALALRDRTKPVKYDLLTNTNYIAIIPLREALREVKE